MKRYNKKVGSFPIRNGTFNVIANYDGEDLYSYIEIHCADTKTKVGLLEVGSLGRFLVEMDKRINMSHPGIAKTREQVEKLTDEWAKTSSSVKGNFLIDENGK